MPDDEKKVTEEKPAKVSTSEKKEEAPAEAKTEAKAEVKTEAKAEASKEDKPAEVKTEAKAEASKEDKPAEAPQRRPPPPTRRPPFQRGGRGRRRRTEETFTPAPPPPPEPEKYDFDFEFPPLFNKWEWSEVVVRDVSLVSYINLDPIIVPHIGARYANKPFSRRKVNIVERLINNMMRTEYTTGNKSKAYKLVKQAFEIINKRTKKNPIQVFIEALEGAAPKEEITRLRYGGISVPKAVDISAARRLDVALRNICKGAHQSSRRNKKKLHQCLADEILRASQGDMQSFAIAKKDEVERIAASAR